MLAKGEKGPLLHTLKARQRVVAAIRWDPREDKAGLIDRIRGTFQQHDLDITCFVFDERGEYIDFVGAEAQDGMDQSGCIYHSGDDMTGEGGGDDEFISAELAGLPDDVAHLVFVVEIRSNCVFGDIISPVARIADGMDDTNLLRIDLNDPAGAGKVACVFACISRNSASETGWTLHHIADFPDIAGIDDWGTYLVKYLN